MQVRNNVAFVNFRYIESLVKLIVNFVNYRDIWEDIVLKTNFTYWNKSSTYSYET